MKRRELVEGTAKHALEAGQKNAASSEEQIQHFKGTKHLEHNNASICVFESVFSRVCAFKTRQGMRDPRCSF